MTSQGRQISRLLSLPAELRNAIYIEVFTKPFPDYDLLNKWTEFKKSTFACVPSNHWIALIYTCRQIYNEALPIAYSKAYFNLTPLRPGIRQQPRRIERFIRAIGPDNTRLVTFIHMACPEITLREFWETSSPWPYAVSLHPYSLDTFKLLRDNCPALTTLSFWRKPLTYMIPLRMVKIHLDILRMWESEFQEFSVLSNVYLWWEDLTCRDLIQAIAALGWSPCHTGPHGCCKDVVMFRRRLNHGE
jgi:hypothetical protein